LAPGKSERGFWAASSGEVPEVFPALVSSKVSFPIPLGEPLGEENIQLVNKTETGKAGTARSTTIKTRCGTTGTLAHPTAEPGYLCVYTGVESLKDIVELGAQAHEEAEEPREPLEAPASAGATKNGKSLGILNGFGSPGAQDDGATVAFEVEHVRNEEEEANQEYPNIVVSGSWAVTAF
jgi:hypothetical protein